MSDEMGGLLVFLLMVLAALVGTQLPAPKATRDAAALLAEVFRQVKRKL